LALIRIDQPDDPRIAGFRDIRERDLTGRLGMFLAEGEVVLNVLMSDRSLCRPVALLLDTKRVDGLAGLLARVTEGTPVYVASQAVLDRIAGFHLVK
jgi:tRNA G18 (ribose-2'-O)-methylase SpoU